ncbi:hypothetical protein F0U60_51615 [Archangium minus]|uniref:Uncharacterized protein n=1 Tax=Archangium minus TaxID=83450 RepID=A0ABY9X8C6_9BACT|nr:hypothetical protein F0U60_51615 [Archangium minus]
MDGAPIEVTHRVVEEHGVPVLLISFLGTYGFGSGGNGDAGRMEDAVKSIAESHPGLEVVVLDGTSLDYQWGDMIGRVAVPLGGRAWVWAVSERCSGGLTSYIEAEEGLSPREWLFEPLAAAVAEVVRRRRAGRFELHDSEGGVAQECAWTERGYRERQYASEGPGVESLWANRRLVERVYRGSAGEEEWLVMWPFPDEAGGRSEACRLGARVIIKQGRIRTLDFNPRQTGRTLRPDWLEVVCSYPELYELDLCHTPVTDEDVARVLERLPDLTRLALSHSCVTDRTLARLAEGAGPALKWVTLSHCQVSREAAQALKAARPALTFQR